MNTIITTTIIIGIIGLIIGVGLVSAGKKFHVDVDPREAAVRECLPGNNCGACGQAGCDAMAAAIARGDAPVNGCPVGGAPVAELIADIMGVNAEVTERKVAFVRCKGDCNVTSRQGKYAGAKDCRSAVFGGVNLADCDYGCIGLGSCAAVCPQKAITIEDEIATVNSDLCVACGLCVKACPKGLIELVPEHKQVRVQCMNRDKGPAVRKVCKAGCIACGLCEKQCENDAIHVEGNVARVTYDNCVQCGKCVEKCPAKVITAPHKNVFGELSA